MKPLVTLCALLSVNASAQPGGLRGQASVRLPDGGIGAAISAVELRFTRENGSASVVATTDGNGRYQVSLPPARYYVLASHPDFQDYASAPGFAVVNNAVGTMNVFLREPAATTVLMVRHGEKQDPNSNDDSEPLSAAGLARAQTLKQTVLRAGVTAVFSTNTVRTRGTVAPYANLMHLPIQTYDAPAALASAILKRHRGDVVLVAAHSNTVGPIANALGARVPTETTGDFDNLYVITRTQNAADVANLQYGVDSTPDITKKSVSRTTFLMVRSVAGANPPGAQTLLHSLRKAGVAAIRNNGGAGLVQPLAAALGIQPAAFTPATRTSVVNDLLTSFAGKVVLVAGTNEDLRAIVSQLNGDVTPVLLASDTATLIFATKVQSARARVIPLLYLP
jgi:hypothetical protein